MGQQHMWSLINTPVYPVFTNFDMEKENFAYSHAIRKHGSACSLKITTAVMSMNSQISSSMTH